MDALISYVKNLQNTSPPRKAGKKARKKALNKVGKKASPAKKEAVNDKVSIHFLGCGEQWKASDLKPLKPFQKQELLKGRPLFEATTAQGSKIWVQARHKEVMDHYGYFEASPYALGRELVAAAVKRALAQQPRSLQITYYGKNSDELLGVTVGVEMVLYQFTHLWPNLRANSKKSVDRPEVLVNSPWDEAKTWIEKGRKLGMSTNLARFLVDLPGNALNPVTYAQLLKDLFGSASAKTAGFTCEVWNEVRLKKEKMGLHIAVGQGSPTPPRMVRLSYRGLKKRGEKPLVFVGKGITFDAGGLNIKPGGSMRLMKKDMGGSASVVGLAHWVLLNRPKVNCDFYLALAENSVAANSFRPGDILQGRDGTTVEIHNTDAEGRLVLADSIALAAESEPRLIFDLATLTGAIKYGLGADVPGLFSTSDNWAEMVMTASQHRGETAWRMPLVPSEKARLRSDVADMVNCTDGFGGAITAAHFLNHFTGGTPWVHLDMYSWVAKSTGPFRHSGGSGQFVQTLAHLVTELEAS